jgi:hypothetical protein
MINMPLSKSVRQADKITCEFSHSYIARDAIGTFASMDVYYETKSSTGSVINPIYFDIIGLVSEICSHERTSKNKQS